MADTPADTTANTPGAEGAAAPDPTVAPPIPAPPAEVAVDPAAAATDVAAEPVADAAPTDPSAVPVDPAPVPVEPAAVADPTAAAVPAGASETPAAGAPVAPVSPTPRIIPAAVPSGSKKKKLLKLLIPVLIVSVIGGAIGGGGYYLGWWGKKNITAQVAQAQQNPEPEVIDTSTLEPALITPECVSGYKPYMNKHFSICYPITMAVREQAASDSALAVTEYVFEDKVETLRVLTEYKGNLNKFDCASSKVVKVATYSALRYQVRDKNPKGGCAGTINEYASLVSSGNEKPIFYVGLSRKTGSYQSDNGAFAAIEQSFRINQP